ncbi:MAG: ATP-binding protein [Opitutales bacterium]
MHLSYPNKPGSLDRLESDLADFASRKGLGAKVHSALQLCLDEALSNVIAHGYAPGESQTIELELEIDANGVTATLTDSGKAFDPLREASVGHSMRAVQDSDADESANDAGMGVFLMRRMLDELHYVRQDGRNVLRLHKRFERTRNASTPKKVASR